MKSARLLAAILLFSAACKDKYVTVTTVDKTPEAVSEEQNLLAWTLPRGWREEAGQGMRYAILLAGPVGRAYEITVTRLPGDAGGALPNVNRWRAQLGLPAVDDVRLRRSAVRLPSAAGPVLLVDFTGKDDSGHPARMLAAMLQADDWSWFFKTVGPKAEVAALAAPFRSLLGSLRRAGQP